ncbi:coiled-coil domain-containing protein 112 [Aplochiton taeniatus]
MEERESQQKKAEFIKNVDSIKKQIEKLEREGPLSARIRKNGWTDGFGELEEYEKSLEEGRKAENVNVQKQLMKIHNGVKKFQRQLTNVKPTPELVEKLKEIMMEVENSISTFKEDQRLSFEELLKEERTCNQEIDAFEKKIETWSLAVKADPKRGPLFPAKVGPLSKDLPQEVRALEVFLQQSGGLQGGWDQYDHHSFLKVWTKHSGRVAYRKEAQLYLPGKIMEEIEQHEQWYQELLCLQDKKKEAIQQWKAGRQQDRQARLQNQDQAEDAALKEKEAQAQALRCRVEEKRREAAARLEEWKRQRSVQEKQEKEQRLAQEILQSRRAKEERRRQLEVKLTVEEQLRQRREEEEEQAQRRRKEEQAEIEERRRTAGKVIRRFQERDLHKVETKLQETEQREQQELERQKRLAKIKEKVESHVNRDRSRLTKPTKVWEERTKSIGPTGGGPILQMFHRAVPSWRQGL